MSNAADGSSSASTDDPEALRASLAEKLAEVRAQEILARRVQAIDQELERLERRLRRSGSGDQDLADDLDHHRQLREQAMEDLDALRGQLHE